MSEDFHSNFNAGINCDIESANECLMRELANVLVRNRTDFIDMLNESGVVATNNMSDIQLINLFIENSSKNKKMLLGAALLVNVHNKLVGFDGEDEISDSGVKTGYAVMNSYFNDEELPEEYSNLILGGLLAKGAKRALEGIRGGNNNNSQAAKQQMLLQMKLQREAEAAKKRKKQNALLIGGGAVVLVGILAFVVIKTRQ
jgi:hypothetical protein